MDHLIVFLLIGCVVFILGFFVSCIVSAAHSADEQANQGHHFAGYEVQSREEADGAVPDIVGIPRYEPMAFGHGPVIHGCAYGLDARFLVEG